MLCLLEGHLHPAVEEGIRHRFGGETGNDIERQIDGVEFDMGDGVQQGDAPLTVCSERFSTCVGGINVRLVRAAGPFR